MLKYCESNGIFVRSLGLDVTQQTLDNLLQTNEAFKDLGVTSSKALLQSDKAMLRLIVVLQNAQNSFGDINRTINTLSNQLRVFESSLSNLRLAIGDLFAEPFRNALIYINAFLIAITKIIRAFKPMATESETAGAGMQQFADDTEDAVDAATGGGNLDFDEFRVLSSGEDEQVSITEAITAELQKQIDAYNEQLQSMNNISNKAVEIAEKIKDWFIVTDNEGNFVAWTDNAKKLAVAIAALTGIKIANWVSSTRAEIIKLIESEKELTLVQTLLSKLFTKQGLIFTAIFAVIAYGYATNEEFRESINNLVKSLFQIIQSLMPVIQELISNLLPPLIEILNSIITVLTPIINLITSIIQSLMPIINTTLEALTAILKSLLSILEPILQMISDAFSGLATLIDFVVKLLTGDFEGALESLGNYCKQFVSFLANSIIGIVNLLIATLEAMVNVVVAIINMINEAVSSLYTWIPGLEDKGIPKIEYANFGRLDYVSFADGGITDANLIMTHENGVREWVGKQGNSTAVVNDTQMSDVMGKAVRNGVLEAMSYNTGNGETFNITVQANLDGQKVYESTRRIARKNGEKFARV